jgi:hypothetical protein
MLLDGHILDGDVLALEKDVNISTWSLIGVNMG